MGDRKFKESFDFNTRLEQEETIGKCAWVRIRRIDVTMIAIDVLSCEEENDPRVYIGIDEHGQVFVELASYVEDKINRVSKHVYWEKSWVPKDPDGG